MTAWPITAAMRAGLTSRQRTPVAYCNVLSNGAIVASRIRIDGGTLNVASSGDVRRALNGLEAVDVNGDLAALDPTDTLAPYGNELAVYKGIRVAGVELTVPVGVFRINRSATRWAGGSVFISADGADRSVMVSDAGFIDYTTTQQGRATDAILAIVSPALPPSQQYNFAPITTQIGPQTFAPGDNRWQKASLIAANLGCLLYFDAAGALVLAPTPDPTVVKPAWTFGVGQASILSSAENSLDRTGAANTIVVISSGSNIDAPMMAVAQDTNTSSPTYVGGQFGVVVKVVQTNLLLDQTGLQNYANTQLLLQLGATQQAVLSALSLPQLDAFDVIDAEVPLVGLAGRYVVDQLSMPLGQGPMSLTTRGIVAN